MAQVWQPATELEAQLRDALRSGDRDGYFRLLTGAELIIPAPPEAAADPSRLRWPTEWVRGRTQLTVFTSPQAMRIRRDAFPGTYVTMTLRQLASSWPDPEWWLAVNADLPIESYLPAWFIQQLAGGDPRLPAQPPAAAPGNTPGAMPGSAPGASPGSAGLGAGPPGTTLGSPMAPQGQPAGLPGSGPGQAQGAGQAPGQGPGQGYGTSSGGYNTGGYSTGGYNPGGQSYTPGQSYDVTSGYGTGGTGTSGATSGAASGVGYSTDQGYNSGYNTDQGFNAGQGFGAGQGSGAAPGSPGSGMGSGIGSGMGSGTGYGSSPGGPGRDPGMAPGGPGGGLAPIGGKFVPANSSEQSLLEAAAQNDNDRFLRILLSAQVIVPVAPDAVDGARPGDPGFHWGTAEIKGQISVLLFTSVERMRERIGDVRYTMMEFPRVIRVWPHSGWSLALNPDTKVGATLPGEQVKALVRWAEESGGDTGSAGNGPGGPPPPPSNPPAGPLGDAGGAQIPPGPYGGYGSGSSGYGGGYGGAGTPSASGPGPPGGGFGSGGTTYGGTTYGNTTLGGPTPAPNLLNGGNGTTPYGGGTGAFAVATGPSPGEDGRGSPGGPGPAGSSPATDSTVEALLLAAAAGKGTSTFTSTGPFAAATVDGAGGAAGTHRPAASPGSTGPFASPGSTGPFASPGPAGGATTATPVLVAPSTAPSLVLTSAPDTPVFSVTDAPSPGTPASSPAAPGSSGGPASAGPASTGAMSLTTSAPAPAAAPVWSAPPGMPLALEAPLPAGARRPRLAAPADAAVMQRVIPHAQVPWYLDEGYDRVNGYVYRAGDVLHLETPLRLYEELGLLRSGSLFSPTDQGVHIVRWPAPVSGVYRPVDTGGAGEAPRGSGNVPVFHVAALQLPHGSEMFVIGTDGSQEFVAVYDADQRGWVRAYGG